MTRADLDIRVHDGRVTIAGVRRERPRQCEQYHRVERGHGSFSRTFHLPIAVDGERVTADLRDGVLTITCPKAEDGAAAHSGVLMKQRLLSVMLLVAVAFTASMVLTGRMRDANEAGAQNKGAQTPTVNAPGPVGSATTL